MSFTFQAADYPATPGCYIMKASDGRILYIGKSKCLRNRLRSYFNDHSNEKRIRQLVSEIASIEVLLVNNEAESLFLENNLIKIHKPPYNRALKKDNSGYAYLQLTADRLPRLVASYRQRGNANGRHELKQTPLQPPMLAPRTRKAGASATKLRVKQHAEPAAHDQPKRLGPFQSSRFRDALIEFVTAHYGLRTCENMPKRACLLYHIGKCSGVCEGKITEDEYRNRANQAAELLENGGQGLIGALYVKMERYASHLEFEKAQALLTHIRILERVQSKQIVDRDSSINQDVLYCDNGYVLVASVREGMLADMEWHKLSDELTPMSQENVHDEEFEQANRRAFDRFLVKRYKMHECPEELIVNQIGEPSRVKTALRRKGRPSLTITLPKRGLKFELLKLCKQNHEYRLSRTSFIQL